MKIDNDEGPRGSDQRSREGLYCLTPLTTRSGARANTTFFSLSPSLP